MGNEEYIFKGDDTKEGLNEEFQIVISNKLKQRSIAKSKRDFNTADTIRDELNKEYNIVINDRNKEWSIDFDSLQEDEDDDENEIDPNLTASLDEENEKYTTILDDDLDNNEEEDEEEEEQTDDDNNEKEIELLNSLTVPKLKEKLKEVGLPVSGRKSELIERLINNNIS